MDADLVATLSEADFLPEAALGQAVAMPEALAAPGLEVLALAGDEPGALTDEDANLLFWGMHALSAARDRRVFAPVLTLLRHDGETLDSLLGDALTETMPRVLASSYDGDAEALHRFILDATVEPLARDAALAALGFLTRDGRLDREASRDLLIRFDEARVAGADASVWFGWEETIAYLGLTDLVPRVEAAWKDGRITDEFSDRLWFRKALRQGTAEPPNHEAFRGERYGYLDHPVAALAWTAEHAGKPKLNPFKTVGRNDPCPCGSGRKYKKCCLGSDVQIQPRSSSPDLR